MRLLTRYLLVRLVAPFCFALAALTGFMLLNQIERRFAQLTGKGLGPAIVAEVFALSLPFILALTIPMAVLVAVLFAFSHLAADSEITAMRASGVSVRQMVVPVLVAASVIGLFTFGFVDQVLPRTNARLRTLFFDIARLKPTLELHEQVINTIPSSQHFLRAASIDQAANKLRNVAIYDLGGQWSRRVVYADSGRMAVSPDGRDLVLRLFDGTVHEFPTSEPADFRLIAFRENELVLRDVYGELERNTGNVVRGDREMGTCEMLAVVQDARREQRQAVVDRRALMDRDLHYLLQLDPPSPPPVVPLDSVGAYCGLYEGLLALALPRTAEAQDAAQLKQRDTAPPRVINRTIAGFGEVSGARNRARDAERRADRFLVEVHKKWAISFASLPFALVAVVLALRFPRGGMGLVIGGAMAVFSVFWVGLTAGEALADKGYVSPWVAMWGPLILLTIVGAIGLWFVSREMGSTRGGDWQEIRDWFRDAGARLRHPVRRARAA